MEAPDLYRRSPRAWGWTASCAFTELDAFVGRLDLTVEHVLSEPPTRWQGPVGKPGRELLEAVIPQSDRRRATYYVCGPPAMIDTVAGTLHEDFGIASRDVVAERFQYTAGLQRAADRVQLAARGITLVLALVVLLFAARPGP